MIPRVFWKCLFRTSKRPYAKPQRKKREVTRMKAQTEKVSVDQKVVCVAGDSRYSRLMIPVFKTDRAPPELEASAPPAIVYRGLKRLSV